jgi:hypothetical protein
MHFFKINDRERREIIKRLTILPLAGTYLPIESLLGSLSGLLAAGLNIYQSIGVDRLSIAWVPTP